MTSQTGVTAVRGKATRRRAGMSAFAGGVVLGATVGPAAVAGADTWYAPPQGTWNGKVVYVSQACHDASDGIAGGPCIPNSGCLNFNENNQSSVTAATTISGTGNGLNLLERGYKAVRGNGTVGQNIANSNSTGADLHVPLHTNAPGGAYSCTSTNSGIHGTQPQYRYPAQQNCGNLLLSGVGGASPGTNDKLVYRTQLGELNSVNAVTCYLEAEFHTWNTGVNWIRDEVNWTWGVGWTVDNYLGYP